MIKSGHSLRGGIDRRRHAAPSSEARLRALLSSLDDLVFELDEDGVYLSAWTAGEQLLVAPREMLLGRDVQEVLGEDIGSSLLAGIRRVIETGRTEAFQYSLSVPAGVRWFDGRVSPVRGDVARVCLVVRDITKQKQSERELEITIERLSLIGEIHRFVLASGSVVDLVSSVVKRMRKLLGADRGSLLLFEPGTDASSFLVVDPPSSESIFDGSLKLMDLTAGPGQRPAWSATCPICTTSSTSRQPSAAFSPPGFAR
jgi:PAS domain S-box-containing protein